MTGAKNNRAGRHAAIAAADRVRLLLTVVEDDEFLSEVLSSANATIADIHAAPGGEPQAPRRQREQDGTRDTLLGPGYYSAKRRALRLRGRGRTMGRA